MLACGGVDVKIPHCRVCGAELEQAGEYWVCPKDGFLFQVIRGKVGKPLWGTQTGAKLEAEEEFDETLHEAFMAYLQSHGWTKESYEKLSEHGKALLFERWKETAGM